MSAEFIIVGGGMAGLLLGTELAARGRSVEVFESGSCEPVGDWRDGNWIDPDFDEVEVDSDLPYNIRLSRVKAFGGSAEAWEGYAYRLRPDEFAMRSTYGVGHDWPLDYADLHTYYRQAEKKLGVAGNHAEFGRVRSDAAPMPPFPFGTCERKIVDAVRGEFSFIHVPQARNSVGYGGRSACQAFGECNLCPVGARWSPSAALSRKVGHLRGLRVRTGMVVQKVVADSAGTVRGVQVHGRKTGTTEIVAGHTVILAAGTLDTVRLLLHSQAQSDFLSLSEELGQGFMDHPALRLQVEFPWRTRSRKRQTNILATSHEYRKFHAESGSPGFLVNINSRVPVPAVLLAAHMEMLPHPDNRITLSEKCDASGMPLPRLSVRSTQGLRPETVDRAKKALSRLAASAGGTVVRELPLQLWACHLMGGARMGQGGDGSVVDRNLKVHGVDNLFVASLAVMPTSSSVNPSLTLASLALRLRDRLLEEPA